jgi:hypothetical protein
VTDNEKWISLQEYRPIQGKGATGARRSDDVVEIVSGSEIMPEPPPQSDDDYEWAANGGDAPGHGSSSEGGSKPNGHGAGVARARFPFVPWRDLRYDPSSANWLVHKLLPPEGFGVIYGKWKSFKSFYRSRHRGLRCPRRRLGGP